MTTSARSDVFVEPPPAFTAAGLRALVDRHWAVPAAEVTPLDSERDLNALVGGAHVLKIANTAESPDALEMETRAMRLVAEIDPGLPIPAVLDARSGGPIVTATDDTGRPCLARLITVVPGTRLEGMALTPALAEQIGDVAGRITVALQGFWHPAAGRELAWDIRRLPALLAGTDDARLAALAERVAPALAGTGRLPAGVQHGDVTLTNVLADAGRVTGVIDFGDIHHTATVCDLAATLTSVLRTASTDPALLWRLAAATLAGYQRHRRLDPAEAAVLGELVIARLITTLTVSAARRERHRDNYAYITQYDVDSERVLDRLAAMEPDRLADRIARLCGTRVPAIPAADLPGRRAAVLGGPLSPLFYRTPVRIERGTGPWLFAPDGTRYLDAYNNVAVVGHAHPAVTNAVGTQLSRLNTHSRYLHPAIVELAERVLATMPAGLDTCLFTTSGTEANELAWRLATAHTGGESAVIARHAYHGTTRWMADLSSNEWPADHRPELVGTFTAPHGPAGSLTAHVAAARIAAAAESLARPPALVLADSQFTSEGVLDPPSEFMSGLVDAAHAAGALYLADEVQSGYGRSGPQLWRFALEGIVPDIVTLGKPMGAGYPIGAVITRRDIADSLAADYEYFSTFAATPAAALAGHAVLDVLEQTGLPGRASTVGALLRIKLRELADEHALLGEVRGTGLLAGVDIRTVDGVPGGEAAARLLEALVRRGVLAGRTGPRGDVLKIRPPLVWEPEHVTLFAGKLADCLAGWGS